MSRILFAWELGGNFGHLSVLLPLARRLVQRGHSICFAVKDTDIAAQLLAGEGFFFIQAPVAQRIKRYDPISFADILNQTGFGNRKTLTGLVLAWRNLFRLFKPDALVVEYGPVGQFAARVFRLPCLQLNSGFGFPPEVVPFPCFRPWLKPTAEQLLARETRILENINAVRASFGCRPFAQIQHAMKSDIDLLATFPELDHYHGRGNGYFIGPLPLLDEGVNLKWPENTARRRIFLYLRPGPELKSILETLKKSGKNVSVIACIPGVDQDLIESFHNESLQISALRVRLAGLLPGMDVAITHGSHGTTAAMLLAGVPMLTIPTNIEQLMLSENIQRLKIGIVVKKDKFQAQFSRALDELLTDGNYKHNVKKMAQKYAGHRGIQVVERLANTLERLIGTVQRKRESC